MYRSIVSGALAIALVLGPSTSVAAQSAGCPIVDESIVSQAIGSPVSTSVVSNAAVGVDLCDFVDAAGTDWGVNRQTGTFTSADVRGIAGLAARYIPQIATDPQFTMVLAQIDLLSQNGFNVALPGYEISAVTGLGDAALLVKTELTPGFFIDSLLVEHGDDAFSFDTNDSPAAAMKLNALAQAILATLGP